MSLALYKNEKMIYSGTKVGESLKLCEENWFSYL